MTLSGKSYNSSQTIENDDYLDENNTDQDDLILPVVKNKKRDGKLKNNVQKADLKKNDDIKEKKALYQQNLEELQAKKEQLFNSIDSLHSPKASKIQLPQDPHNISRSSISRSSSSSLPNSKLTKDQMTKTFEEWMKIAADNKITTKNSWQVALIDYFSDMSLLKDNDGLSINFQKASCTLDGCVKVYTNRVDSVADETGKLLHGLVDSHSYSNQPKDSSNEDDVERDNITESKKKQPHKKRILDPSDTLAKTSESINVSHFDLEFNVDPLFKKTCADFDECGSKGLLLNNVMMDSIGTLSMISRDKDDIVSNVIQYSQIPQSPFLPFISSICQTNNHISHSLHSLNLRTMQWEKISTLPEADLTHSVQLVLEKLDRLRIQGPEHCDNHEGWSDDNEPEIDKPPMNLSEHIHASVTQETKELVPLSSNQIVDGTNPFVLVSSNDSSYFDEQVLKRNWAGPFHWKLAKKKAYIPREKIISTTIKEPFDFTIAPEVNIRQLFSPVQQSQIQVSRESFLLPKAKAKNLLPEDLCIASNEILSLMTKPGIMKRVKSGDTIVTQLHIEQSTTQDINITDDDYGIDIDDNDKENSHHPLNIDLIQPKFIPTETINYNKVSKQVDVHLLKEQLFGSIRKCSRNNRAVSLNNALETMKNDYNNTCSLPICFISLLHLANEHQLVLNSSSDYRDIVIQ